MSTTRRWFIKAFPGAIAALSLFRRAEAEVPASQVEHVDYLGIDFEPMRPPEYEWQVLDDAGHVVAEGVSALGDLPDALILQPGRQYTYRTRGCGL